jgi:hypothetical protein
MPAKRSDHGLFCMPLEKATKEINAKYGNIILKISTAKSFLKSSK